ncbi:MULTISPECIES: glycoside hydrolase family 108 protein [Edwardsiella]|uniref:Glycoside hydrolase family 108 protein n=2 Tax=Edwardsiella TaxID=635 RepID=A0ABY8SBJ9_9GAMM|nr:MULTISPECIES: glycosyl hydrolase 108 family protein [Edwardsiella]AGH74484.1 putative phage lysozyme [Edwardsiella piscicida C07-087]EKS7779739.1 glycoside hydrolase family 108 protein [Edwardsiella piscicida]EKS7783161.1 glycoside hydrolase family 108 protein [Edwardsiella piscicida]EKS7813003.1 glycoside hydrolase family 108 protein [Edwardsiella piscicida]UCQ20185.1 glycoside hydrolase family 108 protein [Edwardsiella piscicida]
MTKDEIFDGLLKREGGYVNHPADRGGPTNWGITEKTARANGYTGDISMLSRDQALRIYRADYWESPRFDLIDVVSQPVAAELLDTGVNMGPAIAAKMLQRCLTALNDGGRLYPDLQVDGVIGNRTANALRAYLAKRGHDGEAVLLKALNCCQGARYIELSESRPANEAFLYGWLRERVALS